MKDTKNYLLGTHYRTHTKETLSYQKQNTVATCTAGEQKEEIRSIKNRSFKEDL